MKKLNFKRWMTIMLVALMLCGVMTPTTTAYAAVDWEKAVTTEGTYTNSDGIECKKFTITGKEANLTNITQDQLGLSGLSDFKVTKYDQVWVYELDTKNCVDSITGVAVIEYSYVVAGNSFSGSMNQPLASNNNPRGLARGKAWTASGTDKTQQTIDDIKNQLDIKADIGAAAGTLAPIIEVVNTFIGVLATAILILIGLFTAIDVLYLEVPALHASMDDKAMEKGQTNKSGGVKPKIVSEDASNAYKEAQESGKNVMIIYLKKRIVAYVAVAIVLYMLLSGNMSLIVEVILKALNGVFGWVEEYSGTM